MKKNWEVIDMDKNTNKNADKNMTQKYINNNNMNRTEFAQEYNLDTGKNNTQKNNTSKNNTQKNTNKCN